MADFGDPESTLASYKKYIGPPLGVLSLSAVLCNKGITPQVINLDKLFFDFLKLDRNKRSCGFLTFVIQHLESLSFDILGLSTICSSYPLTLRIAREVKRYRPDVKVILGGPQASVVDTSTMKTFPFIDFVIRGEAEDTFPILIEALSDANVPTEFEKISGITFRRGPDIVCNPNAPPILDLDSLPLPAYYLDPFVNEYKTIHLEVGRGCPFNCTFCSTSDFFNRKFRLKSPHKMIEQMKSIKDMYGINNINLIHDNFTLNRKRIIEFCESLLRSKEEFIWSCSARTDNIDDELIDLMAKAGCKGIFFGIETGSSHLQCVINKKLNLSEAVLRIRCADQHGIKTGVSLITAFPEETKDDFRDTVHFFVDLVRFSNVEPQLALLAPLAGSPLYAMYKDKLLLDYIFSDMSFQGWSQNSDDLEMIKANPKVFPNFYSIPTSHLDRMYFKEVRDFITAIHTWFRWLPLVLLLDSGDLLKIFDLWKIFQGNGIRYLDFKGYNVPYYNHMQFPKDFLNFIRMSYINEMAIAKTVISETTDIENFLLEAQECELDTESQDENPGVFSLTSIPYKPKGLHVSQLNIDYKELLQCLRNKKNLKHVPFKDVTIAFRTINRDDDEIDIRALSPLSKELLDMCDGSCSVGDIICQFTSVKPHINGVPSEKACFLALSKLFTEELIDISSN